jgi:hypothetical protein
VAILRTLKLPEIAADTEDSDQSARNSPPLEFFGTLCLAALLAFLLGAPAAWIRPIRFVRRGAGSGWENICCPWE